MKRRNSLVIASLALLTLGSCTARLTPYTSRLHQEVGLDEYGLKQVQFYVSKDITLTRDMGESETEVTGGRIKLVNGRRVEEVLIPAGTPGVLMEMPGTDQLAISFEANSTDYLLFGANTQQGGAYSLMAKDWTHRVGQVLYGGRVYRTTPESAGALLLVDVRKLNKLDVHTRTASGRRVGG
jgi:hypothetical protein